MSKLYETITKFQFIIEKISKISILILLLFVFSINKALAFNDSTNSINLKQADSSDVVKVDSSSTSLNLIVSGGAGMITGFNSMYLEMKNGPISGFGIEVPFSKVSHFSFELYSHYWIAKSNNQYYWNNTEIYYNKINDNYYSQFGLSASLKYQLFSIGKRFKFYTQLGWLFYSLKPSYRAFDFGYGLNYKISDSYTISLNRRFLYKGGEFFSNNSVSPNSILLMINYKFNMKF